MYMLKYIFAYAMWEIGKQNMGLDFGKPTIEYLNL